MKNKKLSSEEIKQIELNLLLKLDEICKKYKLRYYLCGGTLLGAVRHKGFIPWDDDIDVLMPREDFEKLLRLEKKQKQDAVEKIVSWKSGNSIYPFIKLINTNTVLKEKYLSEEFTTGIWIDKTILLTAYSEMGKGATWYAALAKRVLIPICKHLNTEKLCNKLNAISKEYPIDKSPYVGGFLWGYGPQEKMPKEFLEPVEVEFEGHMFPAPKCWDFYLTQLYGDYMQLPPENKRISHDFNVYMKENKE